MSEKHTYFAYLLRLWKINRNGQPVWWASLETPATHEHYSFANLHELFEFLERQTRGDEDRPMGPDEGATGA